MHAPLNELHKQSAPVTRDANNKHLQPERTRVRVFRGSTWRFVYIEPSASGDVEFWDEEPGEVRRYRYNPTSAERTALLELHDSCHRRPWPGAYLDLDLPKGSLNHAKDASLAAFRHYVHAQGDLLASVALDRRIAAFLQQRTAQQPQHTQSATRAAEDSEASGIAERAA